MRFTDTKVFSNFTSAFGGTSSSPRVKDSFGPVLRLGVDLPLGRDLLAIALAATGQAHSAEPAHTLAIGYAAVAFNVKSHAL